LNYAAINLKTSRETSMVEGVLGSLPLFARVGNAHIAALAAISRSQGVQRGATIWRQGDPMTSLLVLAYGSAMLALRRPEGGRRAVRFLAAKEPFDVATALQMRACPVDIVALTDSLAISVPTPPLLRLLDLEPGFTRNLLSEVSENYLGLLQEMETSVQKSALQRLGCYLVSLAEPNGSPHSWIARLPTSKTAIAERLGVTKETMSRLLRELTVQGSILVAGREITILDRERLAAPGARAG